MTANGPTEAVRQKTTSWILNAVLTVGMISGLLASLSPLLREQPPRAPTSASRFTFARPESQAAPHRGVPPTRPQQAVRHDRLPPHRSPKEYVGNTNNIQVHRLPRAQNLSPPASPSVYWSPEGERVRHAAALVTAQSQEPFVVPAPHTGSIPTLMVNAPHPPANQAGGGSIATNPESPAGQGLAVSEQAAPAGALHRGGTVIQLGPPVVGRAPPASLPPDVQIGPAPFVPRTANLQAPVPPPTRPAPDLPNNPPAARPDQPAEVLPPFPSVPLPPPDTQAIPPGSTESGPPAVAPGGPGIAVERSQGNDLWEVNGDKITMHLDEVPVRRVLEMFSRSHSMNILVAPGVEGTVTANFEGVTIDEAVEAVLQLCRLSAQKRDNMMFVHADSEVPNEDLQLQVFPLDFASAESLLPTVQSLMSPSGKAFPSELGPEQNNRQSSDGNQSPRWNPEALVVTDVPVNLARVAAYIQKMDRSPKQVLIEAHVLEVELDQDQRHGVNYSHILGDFQLAVDGMATTTSGPTFFAAVDTSKVASLLECLRTTANSKTLASPRVMVVNGETARIQVGQQLGYKVVTTTQAAAVEEVKFLEVGVVLQVTPRITRDNRILMRVRPKVSSGEVDPETLLPQEQTREVETDVMLTDGQGVVIGGLIEEEDLDVTRVIPYIVNVPVIGKLFSKRINETRRSEIVITLIPRVVHCPPGAPLIGAEEMHGRPVASPQCYPGEVEHHSSPLPAPAGHYATPPPVDYGNAAPAR